MLMRWWFLPVPFIVLLAFGCSRPDVPALQSGDVARPEISVAPREPWHAGDEVAIGVLVRVQRPDGEGYYLKDKDVVIEQAVMNARWTLLDGERPLGDPTEVPLLHDC